MSRLLILAMIASLAALTASAHAAAVDPCKAKARAAAAAALRADADFAPVDPENGFNEIKQVVATADRGAPGKYTVTVDFGAKGESDQNAWITAIYTVTLDPAHGCRQVGAPERTE